MQTGCIVFFFFPIFLDGCCVGKHQKKITGILLKLKLYFNITAGKTVLLNVFKRRWLVMVSKTFLHRTIKMKLKYDMCPHASRSSAEYYAPAHQSCGGGNLYDAVHKMCEPSHGGGVVWDRRRKWTPILWLWKEVPSWSKTFWKVHLPHKVNNHVSDPHHYLCFF